MITDRERGDTVLDSITNGQYKQAKSQLQSMTREQRFNVCLYIDELGYTDKAWTCIRWCIEVNFK